MTYNIKVIRATEFVRAQRQGDFDLERSALLLEAIARAAGSLDDFETMLDDFETMVDTRQVTQPLGATELWFLAEKLVKHRHTFARKTAVLCPEARFEHARFFSLCAERRGFNIQPFTGYEEAMDWLTSQSARL